MGKLDIAREYQDKPAYMVDAVPAFKALAAECQWILKWELSRLKITEVAESEPYPTSTAMFADIEAGGLKVSTLNCTHPQWSVKENIAFRIVHDILGHHKANSGFSWKGELAAYRSQSRFHTPLACEALFTEVVGQTACYSLSRMFPDQKVILLGGRHDTVGL